MDYSNKYWQLKQAHPLTVLAALSACLPCHPACLASPNSMLGRLPCLPTCLFCPPSLSAHLLCMVPTTSAALVEVDFLPTNML